MDTSFKKDLAKEIVDTLNKVLSVHNEKATEEIKKAIQTSGKTISKKFTKELRKAEKKTPKPAKKKISGKNSVVRKKKGQSRSHK